MNGITQTIWSIDFPETFCFDIEEKSSDSTTSHSYHSLPEYESFCFDVDHIEEKSSGSTTSHSDLSLLEYESFHFDPSIDSLLPADRSDSHLEEFVDELAHIISSLEYDHFYFDLEDISSLDPPESTLVIDEYTLLVIPLPDFKEISLREVERFDPFFSLTQSGEKTRVMETPSFGFHHMSSPRPAAYSPTERLKTPYGTEVEANVEYSWKQQLSRVNWKEEKILKKRYGHEEEDIRPRSPRGSSELGSWFGAGSDEARIADPVLLLIVGHVASSNWWIY
ncbi:hypothetical protein Tco_1447313 [Tanacetum coccineum]